VREEWETRAGGGICLREKKNDDSRTPGEDVPGLGRSSIVVGVGTGTCLRRCLRSAEESRAHARESCGDNKPFNGLKGCLARV
jgi:hypothetical protein